MRPAAAVLAAAAILAASCGSDEGVPSRPAEPISIGPPQGALPPGHLPVGEPGLPPGHPPTGSARGDADPAPAPAGGGISADRFRAPEGWQPAATAGAMRLLQFRLPRADGDARDGEVVVFGNAMGSTKANIERWRGQFSEVAQGKDSLEETAAGEKGKVHLLDITGRYSGGMGPAAGGPGAAEGVGESRMIAAVVEIPAGTYYVKATGPPATMGKWERSIREFILESAKK